MIAFVQGLFYDLKFRISKMSSDLEGKSGNREIPQWFFDQTKFELAEIRGEVEEIITSGDLELEAIASNNFVRYNTIFETFQSIELFRFDVITKYGKAETYFNKKIARIYDETKNPQRPPLVAAISNSQNYYWAHPYFSIIAVPFGEERNLLNLPDLYHEVSHFIFKQYAVYLINQIEAEVKEYHEREIARVAEDNRSDHYIQFYQTNLELWLNGWIEEFSCDLIATYLVGPAYAWTNLKLSTISSGHDRVYRDSNTHPSDESRMRAIIQMLRLTGQAEEANKIDQTWQKFLAAISNPLPQDYHYKFPDQLIRNLADSILKGCRSIGLREYSQQLVECVNPISKVINDAWSVLLSSPSTFGEWEENAIAEIQKSLS